MAGVLPLGVIKNGLLVDVNDAFLSFLDHAREDVIGRPFLDHVAPHDRARVSERHERRLRGEAVPESYELDIVRRDGATRNVEVWIRRSGEEVIFEIADRTHLAQRRAHLRALAGLGAAVQREHDEARIFATLAAGLVDLGVAWTRAKPDGDSVVVIDVGGSGAAFERFEEASRVQVRGARGPWSPSSRKAWSEGSAFLDDLPLMAQLYFGGGDAGSIARTVARESTLGRAIALRIDVDRQPSELLFVMADWLLEDDVASFDLLRIQVSSALDAARVIADLFARNEELAALNTIGAVAGTGSELDALFDITASSLRRLLGTRWLSMYLFDETRAEARLTFHQGLPAEVVRSSSRVVALEEAAIFKQLARERRPVVWTWDDMGPELRQRLEPMRFVIGVVVPLIAAGRVIGALNTGYDSSEAMRPTHLEVLQGAGAHFAAAVRAKGLLDDLRKSYADLARAQEQLVQRERLAALGELAAIVAHEIRNPLGAVFNAISAIRRQGPADEQHATLLGILEEEAIRMNVIVGDLLDFARPVSAALRPERLEPIVVEAIDAATTQATGPVTVERDVATDLPPVPVDGRLLRQAILNVAMNAVQALGPRGGRIALRMRHDEGAVRIDIADTGPGIATEHQARVFDPFFTTRPSGTGLGLTVVKRIVDVHHGETSLHTTGSGTTFTIRLPVAPLS